jgi:hypothetical protein
VSLDNLLDQASNCLRWLSTVCDPLVRGFEIENYFVVFLERVVGAKDFQETAITTIALIRSYDAVERAVLGAFAAESDNDHRYVWAVVTEKGLTKSPSSRKNQAGICFSSQLRLL